MKEWSKTEHTVLMGLFTAIVILLAFTPIGYIQLPFIKATVIHIPVIIASVLLGYKYGAILGFLFGATSLFNNTVNPALSSFAFSPFVPLPGTERGSLLALVICFVPRVLVGVTPYFVFSGLNKLMRKKLSAVSFTIAGVIGSLTNTLLVMHLIYFLFKDAYASIRNVAVEAVYGVILGIIAANGIPEAIVAGVLTAAICGAVKAFLGKGKTAV